LFLCLKALSTHTLESILLRIDDKSFLDKIAEMQEDNTLNINTVEGTDGSSVVHIYIERHNGSHHIKAVFRITSEDEIGKCYING
jgi:hypothetical protein